MYKVFKDMHDLITHPPQQYSDAPVSRHGGATGETMSGMSSWNEPNEPKAHTVGIRPRAHQGFDTGYGAPSYGAPNPSSRLPFPAASNSEDVLPFPVAPPHPSHEQSPYPHPTYDQHQPHPTHPTPPYTSPPRPYSPRGGYPAEYRHPNEYPEYPYHEHGGVPPYSYNSYIHHLTHHDHDTYHAPHTPIRRRGRKRSRYTDASHHPVPCKVIVTHVSECASCKRRYASSGLSYKASICILVLIIMYLTMKLVDKS